jgi:hypothetical protein
MRERATELLHELDAPSTGEAVLELIPAHH